MVPDDIQVRQARVPPLIKDEQENYRESERHVADRHGQDRRNIDRATGFIRDAPEETLCAVVSSSKPLTWCVALDEKSAADFLRFECGIVVAPATLRKRRCVGGGPPFFKAGRRVFYEPEPLRIWGLAQRSPNVNSTSELDELARSSRSSRQSGDRHKP